VFPPFLHERRIFQVGDKDSTSGSHGCEIRSGLKSKNKAARAGCWKSRSAENVPIFSRKRRAADSEPLRAAPVFVGRPVLMKLQLRLATRTLIFIAAFVVTIYQLLEFISPLTRRQPALHYGLYRSTVLTPPKSWLCDRDGRFSATLPTLNAKPYDDQTWAKIRDSRTQSKWKYTACLPQYATAAIVRLKMLFDSL